MTLPLNGLIYRFDNPGGTWHENPSGIGQWDDTSGNNRHLIQAADARKPLLVDGQWLAFDGLDDYLKTNVMNGLAAFNGVTVMCVLRRVRGSALSGGNLSGQPGYVSFTKNDGYNPLFGFVAPYQTNNRVYACMDWNVANTLDVDPDKGMVLSLTHNGTSGGTVQLNMETPVWLGNNAGNPPTSNMYVWIGGNRTDNVFAACEIGAAVGWNRVLSDTERADAIAFLKQQFSIGDVTPPPVPQLDWIQGIGGVGFVALLREPTTDNTYSHLECDVSVNNGAWQSIDSSYQTGGAVHMKFGKAFSGIVTPQPPGRVQQPYLIMSGFVVGDTIKVRTRSVDFQGNASVWVESLPMTLIDPKLFEGKVVTQGGKVYNYFGKVMNQFKNG